MGRTSNSLAGVCRAGLSTLFAQPSECSISGGRFEAKGWPKPVSSVVSSTRIAFCITDLDPGGAERALVQLVTRLDRSRWTATVFCLAGPGPLADELRAANIEVVCFGAKHWRSAGVVLQLARALRRFQPALVQTFLFHANLAGRIAARLAGITTVVSGIRVAERRSRLPLWIDRSTNWLVKVNVCVSQAVADFSIRNAGLAPNKTIVIPNGVDADRFISAGPADLAQFGIPAGSRTVLTVGRLDPQKGLGDLIEAASLVAPRVPQAQFLIVGEGPERSRIERDIAARRLGDRVHLAGWRADIPAIMVAGSLLVLSSHWEGLPNVVLEAMAAGLPVVATRVEGVDELVIEAQTGLLVAPRSPKQLAAAIEQMLTAPDAARTFGAAGRRRVQAEFSWAAMSARYAVLYESLTPA
jgi:glycosyltransferase involved in cell wall biosynthesis